MSEPVRPNHHIYLRNSTYLLLAGLLIALLIRERGSLQAALDAVRQANLSWVLLGVLAMFISLPASALVYQVLSPKPLRFGRTVLVQMAGFCVNKLLPSGSGAAGTSFLYLRANRLSAVQAGSIVLLNTILGIVGHGLLFGVLMWLEPSALKSLTINHDTLTTASEFLLAGLILITGLVILFRAKLERLTKSLRLLLTRPLSLLKALAASMVITLSYVVCVFAAAEAVGIHMTLASAIIALSTSVLATAVVPTPGGIGAAEAGAYGGLIALGIPESSALAAALLFRVCTFWVPLVVGSVAFTVVVKRGYLRRLN